MKFTALNRPKILYLTNSDLIGGMERCVVNLSREFAGRGCDVRCVFVETPQSRALLGWCEQQEVHAETNAAMRSYFQAHRWSDLIALSKFVRAQKPSLVHLHYAAAHLSLMDILAVRLAGARPCIASLHNAVPWDARNERQRKITRVAAALVDEIIVYSEAVRQVLLEAGVPARKLKRMRLGTYVPKSPPGREDARRELALKPNDFVVATCARAVEYKGIGDLIEAVARLPDPERVVLLVAGDGPDRAMLEAQANARLPGRVRFLGHRDDVSTIYAAADIFSLPSWDARESFGLVFIEAAMQGRPVIGTRVGGIPEAVVDGVTGLLVSPRDPAALSAAIQRLRDDPALAASLGNAGRTRALEQFTASAMADSHARAYGQFVEAAQFPRDASLPR